ncbi:MAG: serine hydrolase [Planctomycetota bacterium]
MLHTNPLFQAVAVSLIVFYVFHTTADFATAKTQAPPSNQTQSNQTQSNQTQSKIIGTETLQLSVDTIDQTAERMLTEQHLPGLAIVVVQNGRTVFNKGYGLANVEQQIPVDPDKILFRIGSVSKALTFLLLTRLVDQGRLKRTDNVEQFIDNVANPFGFRQPVTIDHLLQHTGGFDQIGTNRHVRDHHLSLAERKKKRLGIKAFLESGNLRRVTQAGEMFRYDTYGVTLAGAIIEKVTGQPFATAMKKELFEPLGMRRSFVEVESDFDNDLAMGYGWQQDAFQPRPYEVYETTPASSVDMTPEDMGLLMQALTNDGANENGRLLSKKTMQSVLGPQFRTHPTFVGITHGFFESYTSSEADTDVHLRTIGHGGSMDGYRCALTIIPEKRVGVFLIANRAPESGGGQVDFRPILKLVINEFSDAPKAKPFPIPTPEVIANRNVQLREYAGDYYYGVYCHSPTREDMSAGAWSRGAARSVSVDKDILIIGDERYLPYEDDLFVQSEGRRQVHFSRDSNGKVTNFVYSTSPDTFEKENPDRPYQAPESLAQQVFNIANNQSAKAASQFLATHLDADDYYIRETEMNNAGYLLLEREFVELAIKVFETNVSQFPASRNAWDSLGEACAVAGKTEAAIQNYQKSIELNPNNETGKQRLSELMKRDK